MSRLHSNSLQDFTLLEEIGYGGFATVYKAHWLSEKKCVALKKIIKKEIIGNKLKEERVKQEIQIHSRLLHPNIVKFEKWFEDQEHYCLVLEYCSKGSLEDYMKKGTRKFSEPDAHDIIIQVVKGLEYLHKKLIIHRDITLRNILLTGCPCYCSRTIVKIADFGLATKLSHYDETKHTMAGTPNFMSPEVVKGNSHSFEYDCWSLGCVFYALLVGKPPFDEKGIGNVCNGIVMTVPIIPDYISDEARKLINDLLKKDQSERPTINDLSHYTFFKKYEARSESIKCKFDPYISRDSGKGDSISYTSSRISQNSTASSDSGIDFPTCGIRRRNVNNKIMKNNYPLETINSSGHSYGSDSMVKYSLQTQPCFSESVKIKPRNSDRKLKSTERPAAFENLKNKIYLLPTREKDFCESSHSEKCIPCESERNFSSDQIRKNLQDYSIQEDDSKVLAFDDNKIKMNQCRFDQHYCSDPSQEKVEKSNCSNLRYHHSEMEQKEKCRQQFCKFDHSLFEKNLSGLHPSSPQCSHAKFCYHDNTNCSHELACSCQKHPINDCHFSCHHSISSRSIDYLKEKNYEHEPFEQKHFKLITEPLCTIRLPVKRYETKNAVVSILKNGQVALEFFKIKKKEKRISVVCNISSDGLRVSIFKPKGKCIVKDEPPPFPNHPREVKYFSLENLPEIHHKKYLYAKRFVDIIRAKTPKITIYGKEAKIQMMENLPDPDFYVDFYGGGKITKVGNKTSIYEKNDICHSIADSDVPKCFEVMWNVYKKMKRQCEILEKHLQSEILSQEGLEESIFPVTFGKKPDSSFRALRNLDKENKTLLCKELSNLHKRFDQLSYEDSINNKRSNSSWQNSQNSPSNDCIIEEILPKLKCPPKVKYGKILAEYKDGMQLWSSKNSQEVYFYNTVTGQRILDFRQNSELRKRIQFDLKGIIWFVLSKEEDIT